jgi:hypothetical protein
MEYCCLCTSYGYITVGRPCSLSRKAKRSPKNEVFATKTSECEHIYLDRVVYNANLMHCGVRSRKQWNMKIEQRTWAVRLVCDKIDSRTLTISLSLSLSRRETSSRGLYNSSSWIRKWPQGKWNIQSVVSNMQDIFAKTRHGKYEMIDLWDDWSLKPSSTSSLSQVARN